MKSRNTVLAVLVVFSLAGSAGSQEKAPQPPDKAQQEKQMADEMAAIQPGAAHQKLTKMAGEWTTTTRFTAQAGMPPEETSGTAKLSMVLDGRFLQEESSGAMMNMPYKGLRLTGYNNAARQYEGSWTWTMSTAILRMTGKSDDDGKTVTYAASFSEANGGETKMTVIVKQGDDDHFSIDINGKYSDGSAGPHLETMYTRKK